MYDREVPSIFVYFPVEQNIWKDRSFTFVPPPDFSPVVIINLVNKSTGALTVKLM